jgi:hypothetical protein
MLVGAITIAQGALPIKGGEAMTWNQEINALFS